MAKKSPNPIDKHVGARVRMRRMMLSMSQEKLGDAIGLTFQQVQKYERGTNRVGSSRLQQIADALTVPVSFFFEGQPGRGTNPASSAPDLVTDFFTIPGANELAEHFTAIDLNADRRALIDVARGLAGRTRALSQAAE